MSIEENKDPPSIFVDNLKSTLLVGGFFVFLVSNSLLRLAARVGDVLLEI